MQRTHKRPTHRIAGAEATGSARTEWQDPGDEPRPLRATGEVLAFQPAERAERSLASAVRLLQANRDLGPEEADLLLCQVMMLRRHLRLLRGKGDNADS